MSTSSPTLRRNAEAAFEAGNFPAVQDLCRQLLVIDGEDSLAHYLLSHLATMADQHRAAVAHALSAAGKAGALGLAHACAVSLKLISVGEYAASSRLLMSLEGTHKRSALPQLTTISRQFSVLEQHQRSLEYLKRAERFGAVDERTHYLIGNAEKFLGNIDVAAERYEACLRINPGFSFAHWSLAYLGKQYNDPTHVARIRAVIASGRPGESERIVLNYALFKELDAVGEYDDAWAALTVGSGLKNRQLSYSATGETAIFDGLINQYDSMPMPPENTTPGPRPIFIVGMPRTGTTLLERILSNHPSVAICGELSDLRMQFKWCADHASPGFFDAAAVGKISTVDHAVLGARYLDHVRWRIGDSQVFTDKNPGNFMMVGAILAALPEARILHLRRDPMDSCFSNLKELFAANNHAYSYDLGNLASHHGNYSRLMAHWRTLAPSRILDVHYETLVSDPASVGSEVMRFCGLDFQRDYINIESSQQPVSTASSAQVREPIHSRFVGTWKHYASHLAGLKSRLDAMPRRLDPAAGGRG